MSIKQLQAPSLWHVTAHTLLILGQMLLLIMVWAIFFVWALLATDSLFIPWIETLTREQGALKEFFTSYIGAYLPAFIVVMISLMLFFYRMPRAQEKASVPLEFALTIMLFIALHLFIIGFALPWMAHCLPSSTDITVEQLLSPALLPVQTCLNPSLALTFTGLALMILFWLQGAERLWQPAKQQSTRILSPASRTIH